MNREAMSKQDVFWILSCFLGLSLPEDPANQLCVQRQPANPAGRYRLCLAGVARSTVGPRVRCCFRRALVWNFGFKILAPLLNFGFCNLCRDHRLCWAASCLWPLVRSANGSVGLRQLFVKRSCVDASLRKDWACGNSGSRSHRARMERRSLWWWRQGHGPGHDGVIGAVAGGSCIDVVAVAFGGVLIGMPAGPDSPKVSPLPTSKVMGRNQKSIWWKTGTIKTTLPLQN